MAIIKAVNSKASIGKGINYITKNEKTEEKLISGIDCNPETAIDEMKATKELYNKKEGRQYKHYIQSFNPKDNEKLSLEKAHDIGRKFIEETDKFKGYEVVMATHKDKNHIHNHFIVNSVNFETGEKYQESKKDLEMLKEKSNELSRENGLTIPKKSEEKDKIISFNQEKYQALKRHSEGNYKSYLVITAMAVNQAKGKATSKEDFIKRMEDQGFNTNWKDTRKHITFINKETDKKVRLANLEKTFKDNDFKKENLITQIELNKDKSKEWTSQDFQKAIDTKQKEILTIDSAIENIKNPIKGYQWQEQKIKNIQGEIKERSNRKYGLFEFKKKSNNQNQIKQLKNQLVKEKKQLEKEKPNYERSEKELKILEEYKSQFQAELNKLKKGLEKATPQAKKEKTNIERTREKIKMIEREREKKPKAKERGGKVR